MDQNFTNTAGKVVVQGAAAQSDTCPKGIYVNACESTKAFSLCKQTEKAGKAHAVTADVAIKN